MSLIGEKVEKGAGTEPWQGAHSKVVGAGGTAHLRPHYGIISVRVSRE